jgi:uncharacterized protein YodC (DUF2158 family)
MSEEAIKVGDVVRLKSGGPHMTVQIVGGPLVYCVWFHAGATNNERTGAYLIEMVEKVPKNGVSGS